MVTSPFDIIAETPAAVWEVSRKELRETPEQREQSLAEFKELLKKNPDLHYSDDDDFLLIFLRPCHFYPESAMKMLRRIAEFKKTYDPLLHDLMPEDEKKSFDYNIVNVLTNCDQHGRRILLVNCGSSWEPKEVSSDQLFRLFYLVHLMAQLEVSTQIQGVVVLMDFNGLSLKQVKALTPAFSKRLLLFIQEAMPLRMKAIHIVNQPFIFNMVWSLFKPFIQDKLKSRMYFHGSDMKKLHQHIDPDYLPANYKGKMPAIDYTGKDWYPCVLSHSDHIAQWNTYGFAEEKERVLKMKQNGVSNGAVKGITNGVANVAVNGN